MQYKEILSGIAILITLITFIPYIRDIYAGRIRPHVFSWVIWGSTTFIVFIAQFKSGGGIGAWPIGISGLITIFIAILAWRKRADISINDLDWIFLVLAISSIPAWYLTTNPLYAVIILTIVDVLGFGPTFKKVYVQPYSESALFFLLFAIRNVLVILSLESHSVITLLFPAVIAFFCSALVIMICWRRHEYLKQS